MRSPFDSTPAYQATEESGSIAIHIPRAGFVATRIDGHFSNAFARRFEEFGEREMARGGFVGMHDWTRVASFDIAVPPMLGGWTVSRLGKIARIVIATTHPIVSLAVRTTNLTIKRIEHLDSAEALLRAAAEELRGELRTKPPTR